MPPRRPGRPGEPEKCPPCFNCLLPAFNCGNAGECNPYDGQCRCPPGFGGQDCLTPGRLVAHYLEMHHQNADDTVCGALTDGDERYPRPEGELCDCKEGWGGINCNGKLAQRSSVSQDMRRSRPIGRTVQLIKQSARTTRPASRSNPALRSTMATAASYPMTAMKIRMTWSATRVDLPWSTTIRCVM